MLYWSGNIFYHPCPRPPWPPGRSHLNGFIEIEIGIGIKIGIEIEVPHLFDFDGDFDFDFGQTTISIDADALQVRRRCLTSIAEAISTPGIHKACILKLE
jgi:hypothetical protein